MTRKDLKFLKIFIFSKYSFRRGFLQKDIHKFDSFDVVRIGMYINDLIGYNSGFTSMYLSEFSQDYICDLNTPKTMTILNGMSKIDFTSNRILLFLIKN